MERLLSRSTSYQTCKSFFRNLLNNQISNFGNIINAIVVKKIF